MIDIPKAVCDHLRTGSPLVLALVITSEGSTPRGPGSMMLVYPDAGVLGSVGGGPVEARVVAEAVRALGEGGPKLLDFNLTGEAAALSDMVCGGRMRVFLDRLDQADIKVFNRIRDTLERGRGCNLAVPISGGTRILYDGSCSDGPEDIPPDLQTALESGSDAPRLFISGGVTFVLQQWKAPERLFIAGAGHVSRPTAQIAAMLGFRVTVMDDRPEFASFERFPQVNEIRVCDPESCLSGMTLGGGDYVVIVTRGHVHDAGVLAQALRTGAGYIGMIGSVRKRECVYAGLRAEGFTDADFTRVHCPIGLSIRAETPEEIAVSIAAELIAHRHGRKK